MQEDALMTRLPLLDDINSNIVKFNGASSLLRQYAMSFMDNKPMPEDALSYFEDHILSTVSAIGINYKSFNARPDDYSEIGVLILALSTLIHQKNLVIEDTKGLHAIAESEHTETKKAYESLKIEYEKIRDHANELYQLYPDPKELAELRRDKINADNRIRLQQQAHQEEINNLNEVIAKLQRERNELDKENEELQKELFSLKKNRAGMLNEFGCAFSVENPQSVQHVLCEIRERFGIPNNVVFLGDYIQDKIEEYIKRYRDLLLSFDINPDVSNPAYEIRNRCNYAFSDEILAEMQRKYKVDRGMSDLYSSIDHVVESKNSIIRRLRTAFSIPHSVNDEDIVDHLKDIFTESSRNHSLSVLSHSYDSKIYQDPSRHVTFSSRSISPQASYSGTSLFPSQHSAYSSNSHRRHFDCDYAGDRISRESQYPSPKMETKSLTKSEAGSDCELEVDKLEEENKHLRNALEEGEKEFKGTISKLSDELAKCDDKSKELQSIIEKLQKDLAEKENDILESSKLYKNKISEMKVLNNKLTAKLECKAEKYLSVKCKLEKLKARNHELEDSYENMRKSMEELTSYYNNLFNDYSSLNEANRIAIEQSERLKRHNTSIHEYETKTIPDTSPSAKLVKTCSELTDEYEKQSNLLLEETKIRNRLLALIGKQNNVIQEYESLLEKKQVEERDMYDNVKPMSPPRQSNHLSSTDFDDIIQDIEYPSNVVDDYEDIVNIYSDNDEPSKQRLIQIIEFLLTRVSKFKELINAEREDIDQEEEEKCDKVDERVDRLLKMLSQSTRFIESIVATNIDLSDDLRTNLLQNVARTNVFLEEFADGYLEDSSIFDILNIGGRPESLKPTLERLFEQYSDFESDEAIELMFCLRHSIAVSGILRKYASDLQLQISKMKNEIGALRNEIRSIEYDAKIDAKREYEDKIVETEDEKVKYIKDYTSKIWSSIENVLRSRMSNLEVFRPISECIERIRNDDNIFTLSPSEFNDALIKELDNAFKIIEEQKDKLRQKEQNIQELRECIQNEPSEIDNLSIDTERDTNEIIERQYEDIMKLQKEREENLAERAKVLHEFEELKKQNEALVKKVEEAKLKLDEMARKGKEDVTNVKNKYRKKLIAVRSAEFAAYKSKIQKINRKIKSMQQEMEIKENEIYACIEEKKLFEQSSTQLALQLKNNESETQQMIFKLKTQNREVSEKLCITEVEKKMIETKLKTLEERIAREKENVETQNQMRQIRLDEEVRVRCQKITEELEKHHKDFMNTICGIFRECTNESIPVNEKSVIQFFTEVYHRLRSSERDIERVNDLEHQLKEIRCELNAPKGAKTVIVIKDILELNKQYKDRVDKLERELKNTKNECKCDTSWTDWAKRMFVAIKPGTRPPKEEPLLRTIVEEAIFASTKDLSLTNKLQSLRSQKVILKKFIEMQREFKAKCSSKPHGVENASGNTPLEKKSTRGATIVSITCFLMFVRRITRMSRHIPTELAFMSGQRYELLDSRPDPSAKRSTIGAIFARSLLCDAP